MLIVSGKLLTIVPYPRDYFAGPMKKWCGTLKQSEKRVSDGM